MMAHLFSQIPQSVLNKAGCGPAKSRQFQSDEQPRKKRVKFYADNEIRLAPVVEKVISSGEDDDDTLSLPEETIPNEPTSSHTEPLNESTEHFDAITQTETKSVQERGTQTEESLVTRPLNDNDIHRLNMQTYSPITAIPRYDKNGAPPLRIGLTLRGKKRKVYYPGDNDDVENEGL